MYQRGALLFMYAETPLHPGAGQGVSYIDLPIQRERFTELPMIQASEVKGCLREYFESNGVDPSEIETVFGPSPGPNASKHAGAVSVSDARLLLFPVRSLYGVFAYITCPFVLRRLKRDLQLGGFPSWKCDIPEPPDQETALITDGNSIIVGRENGSMQAMFEEFLFKAEGREEVRKIAEFIQNNALPSTEDYRPWREDLPKRLCIVADIVFRDFTALSTQVVTRNRIDNATGVVEERGLWTEEYLPPETLLYSIILATKPFKEDSPIGNAKDVIEFIGQIDNKRFQIGGNQTLGQGIVIAHLLKEV